METTTINGLTFTKDKPTNLSDGAYRYKCNIALGVKDDTLIVLDGLFYYPDNSHQGSKGATFTLLDKCNQETIDQRKYEASESSRDIWVDAVKGNQTNLSLSDWCEGLESEFFYDGSYEGENWYNELVEKMKTVEGWDDTEFFDCVGGDDHTRNEWRLLNTGIYLSSIPLIRILSRQGKSSRQ